MILDMPDTTTSAISKALVEVREEGGVVALGRVLTLIIATTSQDAAEEAIAAANDASREHPMRLIVIEAAPIRDGEATPARLDAEIRVGGDAGASEVIVLRAWGELATTEESLVTGLLLPDAPVVVWWPGEAPAIPGESPLGRIAQRRITDASAAPDPQAAVRSLAARYRPGDTDLAWTRLTLWRAQLAAVLDQPPFEPVTAAHVAGTTDSASATLLTAWLALQLGVQATCELDAPSPERSGLRRVELERASGSIVLDRADGRIATLLQPGQPLHNISLPKRSLRDCLADELRRLDPDDVFGRVLQHGLPLVSA